MRLEQLAFWRNPQTAFFTFALSLVLVAGLGYIARDGSVGQRTDVREVTLLVPGVLAFGILAAAFGNLASTLAVLRCDGVLKRIRGTPLSPSIYLSGHLITSLTTCVAIAVSTGLLGWIAFEVYVPLALVSGNFSADFNLPSWLDSVLSALPVKALTDGVRAGYDPIAPTPTREWVVLGLWLVVGVALARRFFRWH